MMISIALRFIPDLLDEAKRIMKAQASRGADFNEGSFMEKIKSIISLIIPLFISAFKGQKNLLTLWKVEIIIQKQHVQNTKF